VTPVPLFIGSSRGGLRGICARAELRGSGYPFGGGRLGRSVALGGFMGVGKSTVGRLVAHRLGRPFVDLDALLVARWGSIVSQLRHEGETAFRCRETEALAGVVDGPPSVIATGGGAWASPDNHALLRRCWRVVLTAPLATLRGRVGDGGGRPLWDGDVEARWEARTVWYAEADAVFETSAWTPEAVADAVVAKVLRWEGR